MSWEHNPYYNPENVGLELIDSVDDYDANYSFDIMAVWRRKSDGSLFYGHDSGCSCPTPFEDVRGLHDLKPLTDANFEQFKAELAEHCWGEWRRPSDGDAQDPAADEKLTMVQRVHGALRGLAQERAQVERRRDDD